MCKGLNHTTPYMCLPDSLPARAHVPPPQVPSSLQHGSATTAPAAAVCAGTYSRCQSCLISPSASGASACPWFSASWQRTMQGAQVKNDANVHAA